LQGIQWSTVPLLVGLPEPDRPGVGSTTARRIIARVEAALNVRFHPHLSRVIPQGHTAAFEGLSIARHLIDTAETSECLVCAVDSYLNASTLYWLDAHDRLKRASHSDGLIPGEAAAVVLLQRAPVRDGVKVQGLGFGQEAAPVLSTDPLLGRGLAQAAGGALSEAQWGFHDLDFRLADVTGESYGFREHTLAEARLVTRVRKEPQPLWHAAEFIGDPGAAAGLVQLAWLTHAITRGYAPGPRALCFASALAGRRASAACASTRLGN
jgi:3-oxoacyl-[acyl-carrier-protein] synthase-1